MKKSLQLVKLKETALIVFGILSANWCMGASGSLLELFGLNKEMLYYILIGLAIFQLISIVVLAGTVKNLIQNKSLWRNKWTGGIKTILVLVVLGLLSSSSYAFDASKTNEISSVSDLDIWLLVGINLVLFVGYIYLVGFVRSLLADLKGKDSVETVKTPSALASWTQKLTDVVPIEHEKDVLLDHNYDGIMELDNNLPPWWKLMFYVSIVFGIGYFGHFHLLKTGLSSAEEYEKEMAVAEATVAAYLKESAANVDESTVEMIDDEARLAKGGEIYKMSCAACHGKLGEGGVGPNFTDKYWLHGGGIKDIFKTIKYGVPEKGMISWKAQLSPMQIQDVSAFILTLQGTNPPNQKEAQGDLYEPK